MHLFTTRMAEAGRLLLAAMLLAGLAAAPARAKKSAELIKEPTGPLKPTTEQLIDAAALAKHQTAPLMLLHTNDIHDIIKAPAKGLGGLAYVAGYVNKVRAERADTLFLDAGDLLQKGDAMCVVSKGEVSYQVLGTIGLDASVPGNHDFFYGFDQFKKNIKTPGMNVICAGLVYADTKEPVLAETMETQIGGVKVGVIGATICRPVQNPARPVELLDQAAVGKRINELAKAMEPRVDLTVLVLHQGTWAGRELAKAAPMVDVVICGHTNEVTEAPMKAETGALVVCVGRAGQWVGSLDMIVDRDQKKIGKYTFEMVPMDHQKIQPDARVARLVDELDKKWAPAVAAAQAAAPAEKGKKAGAAGKKGKDKKGKGKKGQGKKGERKKNGTAAPATAAQ